ncbi:MAG: DUF3187 family protein [Desulfobacteraceae bacterium]|nr:MAG: DUF3187 family protein [Desulfobacteraceae bacterium]
MHGMFLKLAFTFWIATVYICCSPLSWDIAEAEEILLGPAPIINQSPTLIPFLQASPDKAEIIPWGRYAMRLSIAITNTLLSENSQDYSGVIDMETFRTSLDLKVGVLSGLEIGFSMPLSYSYSGIMDEAILDVEKSFGNPRIVREDQTPGRYEYHLEKNGKTFLGGKKTSSGLGDLVITAKGKLFDEGRLVPCVSTRFSFKIPSGNTERALSSGKADAGLGLLLQKRINKLTAYLNGDIIFPGEPFNEFNISVHNFYIFMLGIEYSINSRLSLICQGRYTSRPFRNAALAMLDRRIHDLTLGFNYVRDSGLFIQGGGVEDFRDSTEAGADITFFLNIGKFF